MEERCKEGLSYQQIIYISYTNAAIKEAKERVIKYFDVRPKEIPYFRTIHSLCYWLLGHDRKVVQPENKKEFCSEQQVEYQLEKKKSVDDVSLEDMGMPDVFEGNVYFKFYDVLRLRTCRNVFDLSQEKVKQQFEIYCDNLSIDNTPFISEVYTFLMMYEEFKRGKNLLDYSDMLLEVHKTQLNPDARLLFVDEFQDLTPLQYEIVKLWKHGKDEVILAGDDDQTIYSYAGASPKFLIKESKGADNTIVLKESHRLPRRVLTLSQAFIKQNKIRHEKDIKPAGDLSGEVKFISTDEALKYIENKRTFVLFRTNKQAREFCDTLVLSGIPFRNIKTIGSWTSKLISINNMLQLIINSEQGFPSKDARQFFLALPSKDFLKHGFKVYIKKYNEETITQKQLLSAGASSRIFQMDKNKIVNVLKITERQKEILERHNRHTEGVQLFVDTIHASKGKEAEAVFVCTDTLKFIEKTDDPEEERRVMYVGITRPKEKLFIMASLFSQGDLFYDQLSGIYYQCLAA
jgi:DNA helicase-2/ATP-dependent DNA helicase PcrA